MLKLRGPEGVLLLLCTRDDEETSWVEEEFPPTLLDPVDVPLLDTTSTDEEFPAELPGPLEGCAEEDDTAGSDEEIPMLAALELSCPEELWAESEEPTPADEPVPMLLAAELPSDEEDPPAEDEAMAEDATPEEAAAEDATPDDEDEVDPPMEELLGGLALLCVTTPEDPPLVTMPLEDPPPSGGRHTPDRHCCPPLQPSGPLQLVRHTLPTHWKPAAQSSPVLQAY